MSLESTIKWKDIYLIWDAATTRLPELCKRPCCRSVDISKPLFGPCYYYNWVKNGEMDIAIQKDLAILDSEFLEVGMSWSKGTLMTASLLSSCQDGEELAAVWLCAFALTLLRQNIIDHQETRILLSNLQREACAVFARKYGYWHSNSRTLLPEFYIPTELFWENTPLSLSVLVELAAINAASVLAHYTPIEYKRTHKR